MTRDIDTCQRLFLLLGRRTIIERVGQPVTKVVNPHTGTVITVSADEDEDSISSVQEYDSAPEEIHAPRSVCAEEGPASLGAADHLADVPECRTLSCEHTEICAEMRTASEPTAIDSVPDENIRELQERRALCAEMATRTTSTSIDYEREGAFRDVPTSLSLCAEPGEIPSSPMTQAKETSLWYGKTGDRFIGDKRAEDYHVHERHFAKAKYVVSYDDDSVTLMENKTMRGERNIEMQSSADERTKGSLARKSIVVEDDVTTQKRPVETSRSMRAKKYIVQENEDSVVIEDARCAVPTTRVCTKKEESEVHKKKAESAKDICKIFAREKHGETTHKNGRLKSRAPRDSFDESRVTLKNKEIKCAKAEFSDDTESKPTKSTADVITKGENLAKLAPKAGKTGLLPDDDDDELPPLDPPPLDDFSSIEYHMVEQCKDAASTATQSDDDIEHIHVSEVTQIRARIDASDDKCRDDAFFGSTVTQSSSPVEQRKSSKSTISDDDLEYIHSSEFGGLDSASSGDITYTAISATKASNDRSSRRRHSKHALSSDDDLEHVQLSEICELELGAVTSSSQQEMEQQDTKSRLSKKRKDIMVIEKSETETAEITVIYNPLEEIWLKSEEMTDKYSPVDHLKDKLEGTSPTRKGKSRISKTAASSSLLSGKRASQIVASDIVEIIDIDAMQRADTDADSTPECKILPAATGTRVKKSRKSKKSQADSQLQENSSTELSFSSSSSSFSAPPPSFRSSRVKMADLREAVQDESFVDFPRGLQEQKVEASASTDISWSSVVKKSISLSDSQEMRKETDLEPLIEVEEKPDAGEHARKLKKISEFCDRDDRPFLESEACKHENTQRRTFNEEKEEKEDLLGEKDNADETTSMTTPMEETILVDLPVPVIDEEPRADRDLAGVTIAMARTKMSHQDREDNKEQSLPAPEVRSVVDKTRRGNVPAERKESQRESSLQLQPVLRQQGTEDGGDLERNDPIPALPKVSSEDPGSDACPKHAEKRSEAESSIAAKKTSNRSKRKKRR